MFADPTIDDFVTRIDNHVQHSLERARHTVREIEAKNSARGIYRSGNTIQHILSEILAEFDHGVDGALHKFRQIPTTSKLDVHEMREILGNSLNVYRDQMKMSTRHEKLREFSSGPALALHIDQQLKKFDEMLDFKLRQFDVGFSHTEEAHVANIVIVHGDAYNIVAGNGNISQQGTIGSQQAVNADDIAEKLVTIERELTKVQLSNAEIAEMRGWLATIKAQLLLPEPSVSIVKKAARSLQRVVENAVGNLLEHPLGQAIIALATMVGLN